MNGQTFPLKNYGRINFKNLKFFSRDFLDIMINVLNSELYTFDFN